jgi:TolA-binding protein
MNRKNNNKSIIKIILLFIFMLFFQSKQFAQQSYYTIQQDADYLKGLDYIDKAQYSTAQKLFELVYFRYQNSSTELRTYSQFYLAYCAVRLFNEDAEFLTTKFISDNPESQLVNEAEFNLAGYFYARKKWGKSIEYYTRVDPDKLTKDQWAEYYFKNGYALFSKENYDSAKVDFYRIMDIDTKYTAPALYYYSHIHYTEKNYQTSLNGFLRLTGDKTFGPIAPYYIVQIYYFQERYKDITDFVPGIIKNVTGKRLAEVSRITAEAFSQQEKYEESLPYYQTFLDSADVVGKEDKYQAGYAFYKTGKYDKAIELFGAIAANDDQLAQNASYYLADCYIKVNDKLKARMAFQSAASMDYDIVIKQDALFNYALITYDLSNDPFNEAIASFEEFIKLYPESKRVDEAYKYLIQSYLKARNYKLAIESLDKTNMRSDDLKKAYQRVSFYRGIELFQNLDYSQAMQYFDKSLKYASYDPRLKAKAIYWKSEAFYRLGQFNDAINGYNDFRNSSIAYTTEEFGMLDYDFGYTWFRLKDYPKALESFRKFEAGTSSELQNERADAFDRIGDCFYAQSDYNSAIDYYGRAVNANTGADYALLQKGICQGLVNKDDLKIATLQKLLTDYPKSIYTENALFESARSYIKLQKSNDGIDKLKRLITDYPQSKFAPESYMQLGLLCYNLDNNTEAIRYYKEAVTRFPGTQASRDALSGLKNIYVELNKIDEYFAFARSLNSATPIISVDEQDSLSFITAEKIYNAGNCDGASKAFERYITNFPQGIYLLNANFYKGDCYYQSKDFDKALASFNYVLEQPANEFTEKSLLGSGRIELDSKNYDKALEHYLQLSENYASPENTKEFSLALMRCYYSQKNYDSALKWAEDVLKINKIGPENIREAHYVAGRSLQENGRDMLAIEEYKKIAVEVMSLEGAESKYRLAELYFKIKDYSSAEKEILNFSEKTSPHDYWIARSFLLWAEIFVVKKDYFQAIQTLQSIIDYYVNKDDGILKMANDRKAEILKLQESTEQPKEHKDVEVNVE